MSEKTFLEQMREMNARTSTPENTINVFQGIMLTDMTKEELYEVVIYLGRAHKTAVDDVDKYMGLSMFGKGMRR